LAKTLLTEEAISSGFSGSKVNPIPCFTIIFSNSGKLLQITGIPPITYSNTLFGAQK